jgi:hypothetical protein
LVAAIVDGRVAPGHDERNGIPFAVQFRRLQCTISAACSLAFPAESAIFTGMTQTPPPGRDHLRYDLMVQDALKGVVRKVLIDAGKDGLPGEHHFYISFRTDYPGVRLSQRMREKYPEEMTIVLQHQFWDLGVTEHAFEVGLSFSNVPERLLIPFDSIVGFFDPSVQFGLKFELNGEATESAEPEPAPKPAIRAVKDEAGPVEPKTAPKPLPKPSVKAKAEPAQDSVEAAAETSDAAPDAAPAARVVSLDAFRKKT